MISTTIKESFFKMKMYDLKIHGHFWEFKNTSTHWTRLQGESNFLPTEIVFLVGNRPHRFLCVKIERWAKWQMPDEYKDAVNTPIVWALECVPLHEGDER